MTKPFPETEAEQISEFCVDAMRKALRIISDPLNTDVVKLAQIIRRRVDNSFDCPEIVYATDTAKYTDGIARDSVNELTKENLDLKKLISLVVNSHIEQWAKYRKINFRYVPEDQSKLVEELVEAVNSKINP